MTYIQTTSPRTAVFYGESMADLALMPTTTKIGEGEYIHALAHEGSYAIILLTDGLKKFMLRSTGWVEVKDQGGSGWFEPGGNTTFEDLPTPSGDNVGIVYNITDAFTTDERFNEGAGIDYPAGTNVAIVNVGTDSTPVYKFDTYVGAYTTDDELSLVSENPVQNKVITSKINEINTTLNSLADVATSGSYADLLDKPIVNCTENEYEEIVSELEEGTIVNIYDVHKVVYVGSDNITAILPFWIGTTAELENDLANIPEGFIIIVTDGATQTGVPVNYNLIANHPTVNGEEVVGNKTAVDLKIVNDNTASSFSTYSSNKIIELVGGGGGAESKKLYISSQSLDTETSGDFWIQMPNSSTVTALYVYNNGWQKIDNYFYGSQPPAEYSDGVYWVQIFDNVVARVLRYVSGSWTNPSEGHSMFIDSLDIPVKDDLWIKVNSSGGADGLYSYDSGWTLSADLPNAILAEMLATNSINFHSLTGTQYANTIINGTKNICYGQQNSLTNCNQYLMGGENNTATSANHGAMFGQWNEDSGSNNLVAGSHNSVSSGGNVVAGGYNTVANSYNIVAGYGHGVGAANGLVCGSYANATDAITVGNGTNTSDRQNSMTVSSTGYVIAAGYSMSGADYAEYFEWKDGNMSDEDRRGMLVQLNGDKIVLANGTDINGIVSTKSALCGNAYELYWQGKYKKDEFGEVICDKDGKQILSEDYDRNVEYVPRSQRKEWAPIGLVGQLVVRDNGECKPNDYIAAENGIAMPTKDYSKVKCMKRISDTLIQCLISC